MVATATLPAWSTRVAAPSAVSCVACTTGATARSLAKGQQIKLLFGLLSSSERARQEWQWRLRAADLQREAADINKKLDEARRDSEVQLLKMETEHGQERAELQRKIEKLEMEGVEEGKRRKLSRERKDKP